MKRPELIAWTCLAGLITIALLLLIGGYMYDTTPFWAGMALAAGQAFPVGFAAWGLRLARQRAELDEAETQYSPADPALSSFRLSNDQSTSTFNSEESAKPETRTLDTAFQRTLVAITAVLLLSLAALLGYAINAAFSWAKAHPDKPFPIAGSFDKLAASNNAGSIDELGVTIGLAAAALYCVLFFLSRRQKSDDPDATAAVSSNFSLGIAGMVAVGLASIAAYYRIQAPYFAEIAAGIVAALLILQGVEYLVNAFRTYSAVEELDQPAVDLNALPLVPMLSSVWLSGVKMLFAQSVGLSRKKESGVVARLMPRVLVALIFLAFFISCFRVVQPGQVAVLERLGDAQMTPDGNLALLEPGLHFTCPWPIDSLVVIPTQEIQTTNVGAELHGLKNTNAPALDFQFWNVREANVTEGQDNGDQFVTGDPAPQMLETFVVVTWRVSDPQQFYFTLSHSSFFDKEKGTDETTAQPIYQALVQEAASFAVTRTFASHNLDDIMTVDRSEVESEIKDTLQKKLDDKFLNLNGKGSGIQIVDLIIKDLHPPFGKGLQPDPSNRADPWKRGPSYAYENVTSMREYKETLQNVGNAARGGPLGGEAYKTGIVDLAQGQAAATIAAAQQYRYQKIADAEGEAARLKATLTDIAAMPIGDQKFMMDLAESQAMYRAIKKDDFDKINKILVDPKVKDISLYQSSKDQNAPQIPRPPGP